MFVQVRGSEKSGAVEPAILASADDRDSVGQFPPQAARYTVGEAGDHFGQRLELAAAQDFTAKQ